jgi:hypothetical protein
LITRQVQGALAQKIENTGLSAKNIKYTPIAQQKRKSKNIPEEYLVKTNISCLMARTKQNKHPAL